MLSSIYPTHVDNDCRHHLVVMVVDVVVVVVMGIDHQVVSNTSRSFHPVCVPQ